VNLVLLGPPGAGKGTQANLICEKYYLSHLSTGELLRAEIANKSEIGVKAKKIIDEGKLVSNDIIINVIKSFINNNKNSNGYLLDGFPRNTEQAKLLDELMLELEDKLSCVIQLDVEEKHLKDRILSRGKEEGRSDDNEETLLKRLDTYFNETMPLIKYYDEAKLLKKVSGVGEIMHINQSINSIIDHL
jgi:adenylate kinase